MKPSFVALLGLLASLVLVGCSAASPPTPLPTTTPMPPTATATSTPVPSQKVGTKAVRVIVPPVETLQMMNFWIALGAEFFKEEGLDVRAMEQALSFFPVLGIRPDLTKVNLADYVAPQFAKDSVSGTR